MALGAVLFLIGLANILEPPLTPLGDAQEGARIAIEARIVEVRGRLVTLSDGHHHLDAFLPRTAADVARGDRVRGEGVVSQRDDGLVLSLDILKITLPVASVILSPADLAAEPDEFDGARVVVAGYVRERALVGGGARVAMRGDATPTEGDLVVTGVFRYHETDASYVLWVGSWTLRS
jgi:hypothetical protein